MGSLLAISDIRPAGGERTTTLLWLYRLSARTVPSQGAKTGSIPVRAIWKVGEDGASHLFAKQASLIRTVGSTPTLSA